MLNNTIILLNYSQMVIIKMGQQTFQLYQWPLGWGQGSGNRWKVPVPPFLSASSPSI